MELFSIEKIVSSEKGLKLISRHATTCLRELNASIQDGEITSSPRAIRRFRISLTMTNRRN